MRDYRKEDLYPHTKVLSSSEVIDYFKNPRVFYERWVAFPDAGKRGVALEIGTAFAELYADRSFDYITYLLPVKAPKRKIIAIGEAIKFFPKSNKPEHELKVKFKDWSIRITLDDFYREENKILEIKTGEMEWNQQVVDIHPQITLQAWGYWKKFGELCKHDVVWVDMGYHARKLVNTFKTKRTKQQLIDFENEVIIPVVAGIEA